MGLSRRSERLWILAWLSFCALSAAALGWGFLLGGADEFVRDLDQRWIDRLEVGEALLEAGRTEEAAAYLESLEEHFPAQFIRHKFHRERERLYTVLGRSQAELGRKSDALNTFRELTEYDALNWQNWELLAQAYESFGELELARTTREHLLELHPNHLPTVTLLTLESAGAGRCAEAVAVFEEYLDAFLLASIDLRIDTASEHLLLPADGRAHGLDLPLASVEHPATLELQLNGWSVAISPLTFSGPLLVGSTVPRPRTTVTPAWQAEAANAQGAAWSAASVEAVLQAQLDPHATPDPTTRIALELTAYKAVGEELWKQVEQCYIALGAEDQLARARARTVVGGCPEAGTFFEE